MNDRDDSDEFDKPATQRRTARGNIIVSRHVVTPYGFVDETNTNDDSILYIYII